MFVFLCAWRFTCSVRQWIHVYAIKSRIWLLFFHRYDVDYFLMMSMLFVVIILLLFLLLLLHFCCELHKVVYASLC